MKENNYHEVSFEYAAKELGTVIEYGLSSVEAERRIKEQGYNELIEKPRPGFFKLLLSQFNNFLIFILIAAAVTSLALGEAGDSIAIIGIVILNAVVGVIRESKAEQSLAALKKMSAPGAQVIRDGHQIALPSRELVPGDIVLIEAGNYIPADMRLAESVNLKVEEASLTGESVPVDKDARAILDREIPIGDRKNSVFMSTIVTYGRGRGVVTGTGMNTEIGLIAEMLQSYKEEATPLQKKLDNLAKALGAGCLFVCGLVFLYGLIRDTQVVTILKEGLLAYFSEEKKDIVELFMIAVSLAIAAVPEGLPAVVTICLALGMQRMIKRHALIRKLPAVETLGCATVICSDKTGTLTQNEMTVVQGWAGGTSFKLTGEGYDPTGRFMVDNKEIDPLSDSDISLMLYCAMLCNDAKLGESIEEKSVKTWHMIGDPTEGALVVAAEKAGFRKVDAEEIYPRIMEIPFDSERKMMTTIHTLQRDGNLIANFPSIAAIVKGAPDVILNLCENIIKDGITVSLTDDKKKTILDVNHDMASQALRVLSIAYRPLDRLPEQYELNNIEKNLTFIGLIGMMDPPRKEVKEAVRIAHEAGMKTVMVTGDYKDTAEAVAKEIGLLTSGGKIFTGADLDKMSDEALSNVINDINVCCRVSPQHKTKIIDAFKAKENVVAMTGDGVNDAPALKKADIGIAMGITGTDVSKQTADMVLTDDNYASIISAVEEGRIIYSNIRKFVYFLLVCNIGEIFIVFFSMLFGMPVPFKPIMLLWLNLITDGAPALALGMEKGEPDVMKRPPRPVKEPVINREMSIGLIIVPIVDTIAILTVFKIALNSHPGDLSFAQTMAFITLCVSELLRAYTARSERHSVFSIGIFSNHWMQWAALSSLLLVLITVYVPFFRPFFGTAIIDFKDWLVILPFVFAAPVASEIVKIFIRITAKNIA